MQAALLKLEEDAEQEPGQQPPGSNGAGEAPAAAAAPAQRTKLKLLEDDSLDAVLDGSGGAGPSQPEETQRDRLVRLVQALSHHAQPGLPVLLGKMPSTWLDGCLTAMHWMQAAGECGNHTASLAGKHARACRPYDAIKLMHLSAMFTLCRISSAEMEYGILR